MTEIYGFYWKSSPNAFLTMRFPPNAKCVWTQVAVNHNPRKADYLWGKIDEATIWYYFNIFSLNCHPRELKRHSKHHGDVSQIYPQFESTANWNVPFFIHLTINWLFGSKPLIYCRKILNVYLTRGKIILTSMARLSSDVYSNTIGILICSIAVQPNKKM